MRILYYIPEISRKHGGIYQYSIGLLKILTNDNTHEYFVFNLNNDPEIDSIISGKSNFQIITSNHYPYKWQWGSWYNRIKKSLSIRISPLAGFLRYEGYFDQLIERLNIDVVHCPYQHLPECIVPSICTMHDVQELHFPSFFSAAERAQRAVHYMNIIDKACKVVVSYNHVKTDIINFFNKPEHDVHVILLDMEKLWIDQYKSRGKGASHSNILSTKFLLYPAATWHHKNHIGLIKAIHLLKEQNGVSIKVVCTGHKTPYFAVLQQLLDDLQLNDNFTFLGVVSDDELYSLYMHCHGVVVPTLYEAGSFPLMESILLGRPVVCSNVTSLPETISHRDFTFDPCNISEIADMVRRLWTDQEFYDKNLAAILNRASTLRWNDALRKVLLLYKSVEEKKALLPNEFLHESQLAQ